MVALPRAFSASHCCWTLKPLLRCAVSRYCASWAVPERVIKLLVFNNFISADLTLWYGFIDISAVCLFLFLEGSDVCSYSVIILHCQPCDVCPQCSARFLPAQSPLPVQCSLLVCPGSVLSPPTSHVSAGLFTRTSETGKGCARSHGSSESSRDTAYVVRPWVLHAQASSPWPPAHPQLSSDGW